MKRATVRVCGVCLLALFFFLLFSPFLSLSLSAGPQNAGSPQNATSGAPVARRPEACLCGRLFGLPPTLAAVWASSAEPVGQAELS